MGNWCVLRRLSPAVLRLLTKPLFHLGPSSRGVGLSAGREVAMGVTVGVAMRRRHWDVAVMNMKPKAPAKGRQFSLLGPAHLLETDSPLCWPLPVARRVSPQKGKSVLRHSVLSLKHRHHNRPWRGLVRMRHSCRYALQFSPKARHLRLLFSHHVSVHRTRVYCRHCSDNRIYVLVCICAVRTGRGIQSKDLHGGEMTKGASCEYIWNCRSCW